VFRSSHNFKKLVKSSNNTIPVDHEIAAQTEAAETIHEIAVQTEAETITINLVCLGCGNVRGKPKFKVF
jgi:hypothetical protein